MCVFAILLLIIPGIYGLAWLLSVRPAPPTRHIKPDERYTYVKPKDWKGTPVDRKNRFVNYEHPFYQNYLQILYWLPSHLRNLVRNRHKWSLPEFVEHKDFIEEKNILIWLGHASFYLNIDGIRILIDPHFFNTFIYRRHTPAPVPPEWFQGIDYILLTHDHDDHCDKESLRILVKNNPAVIVLAGLNMDRLLYSLIPSLGKEQIKTADWYRKYDIDSPLEIFFIPSRHYCKRVGKPFNGYLWGGFVIRYVNEAGQQRTLYFEGDSGQSSHFSDVKKLFSPYMAFIGIGAYKPRWFMYPNHMSPQDAIGAFDASGAAILFPMHYGTFNLSNEDMDAPLRELHEHAGDRTILAPPPGQRVFLM